MGATKDWFMEHFAHPASSLDYEAAYDYEQELQAREADEYYNSDACCVDAACEYAEAEAHHQGW